MDPATSEQLSVSFSKRKFKIAMIAIGIVAIIITIWQTGLATIIYQKIMPATVEATVYEKGAKNQLKNANLTCGKNTAMADQNGTIKLSGLHAGKNKCIASAPQYNARELTLKLKRGANKADIELEKAVTKFTWEAKIVDYIDKDPIASATIEVNGMETTRSSDEGKFTFRDIIKGKETVKITKAGYIPKDAEIDISPDTKEIELVPEGKVVFSSNRSGDKQAVYTCNYDGSDQKMLIERIDDTEDSGPVMDKNEKNVVFASTRNKEKGNGGYYARQLFYTNLEGQELTQIPDSYNPNYYQWSSDGRKIVYTANTSANEYSSNFYIYDLDSQESTKINLEGTVYGLSLSPDKEYVAWNQSRKSDEADAEEGVYLTKISANTTKKVIDKTASIYFINSNRLYYSYNDNGQYPSKVYTISSEQSEDYAGEQEYKVKVLSPKQDRLAYISNRDGRSNVFISDHSGENEKVLTSLGTATGIVKWSKNGKYITFEMRSTGESALYVVGIDNPNERKIVDATIQSGHMQ